MVKDPIANRKKLIEIFKEFVDPLVINVNTAQNFELKGNIKAKQGAKIVDGFYFSSIKPKPKDVRLYFFPIYTHPDEFELSEQLSKFLKGKSCFHIKFLDDSLEKEIRAMVKKAIKVYKKDGLIK